MKTNKMLPDSSISKVWENFRKMKGVVVSLPAADWVAAGDGTFTNTIYYDGFTSDEILEIDLYNDGNLTETHISEYDGHITEFDITDGALVAIATTKPTVDIDVICRGAIVGEKVVINGSGSGGESIKIRKMKQADYDKLPLEEQKSGHYIITDAPGLTAKTFEYDDSETQFGVNNVQDAIVELNKKLASSVSQLSGTVSFTHMGYNSPYTMQITFNPAFNKIPEVSVGPASGEQSFNISVSNVQRGGCVISATNLINEYRNLSINWSAVANTI